MNIHPGMYCNLYIQNKCPCSTHNPITAHVPYITHTVNHVSRWQIQFTACMLMLLRQITATECHLNGVPIRLSWYDGIHWITTYHHNYLIQNISHWLCTLLMKYMFILVKSYPYFTGFFTNALKDIAYENDVHMGQVTELRLSCYLVLLSTDSKTR